MKAHMFQDLIMDCTLFLKEIWKALNIWLDDFLIDVLRPFSHINEWKYYFPIKKIIKDGGEKVFTSLFSSFSHTSHDTYFFPKGSYSTSIFLIYNNSVKNSNLQ